MAPWTQYFDPVRTPLSANAATVRKMSREESPQKTLERQFDRRDQFEWFGEDTFPTKSDFRLLERRQTLTYTGLMGPMLTRADWRPGHGFSAFRFGESIAAHVNSGFISLDDRREISPPALETYWCEELGCYVSAVNGVIHQVTCALVCSFKGFNLIGTERDRIIQLLAPSELTFQTLTEAGVADDDPLECVVGCRELGFLGEMPIATNMLYSVELFGTGADHWRRARSAMPVGNDNDVLSLPRSLL